jgi:hypothetical protein
MKRGGVGRRPFFSGVVGHVEGAEEIAFVHRQTQYVW